MDRDADSAWGARGYAGQSADPHIDGNTSPLEDQDGADPNPNFGEGDPEADQLDTQDTGPWRSTRSKEGRTSHLQSYVIQKLSGQGRATPINDLGKRGACTVTHIVVSVRSFS